MAIGSVSVEVVPDARGFHRKLTAELRDLEVKVNVNADTARAKAQIDKLGTANRSITINADADTAKAAAKLDELARTRTASIKANVDQGSFSRANGQLSKMSSNMFSLSNAIFALGPALIPATAAVTAMAGALAAPIATAGAGAGLFGVLSVAAIAKATKDAKAIEQIRKQADAATDPKKAAALTKTANDMTAALPKSERAFLQSSKSIGKGFDVLLRKGNIFEPLAAGASLIGKVLPKLSPITQAFGGAITGVVTQLSKFSDSSGFKSAINFIATRGVSAFKQFIAIAGNVGGGIGGLIKAFAPLGTTVLTAIERATGAFKRFGQAAGAGKSEGFQNFLDYVRRVGPKVGTTLVDIGKAVGRVVLALAPQGSTVLGVIDALAKAVTKMKPSQIAAVATAVGALGLATGKFGAVKSISLLISGLSYAYNHSNAFHALANDAGKLAAQLNNLPDVAKLLGGGALLAGALKLRGGGTKGGVAGVAAKLVGGGIQKVLVVNWPAGGVPGVPGVPGKVPPVVVPPVAEGGGIFAALRAAVGKLLIPLPAAGAVGHDTAPKGQDFGGNKLLSSSQAALGRLGKLSGEPVGNLTEIGVAISKVDSNFAKLARTNPQKALLAVQAAAKSTGVPIKDLQTLLPRTAKSLGDLGANAKKLPGQLSGFGTAVDHNAYSMAGLQRATRKAGISASDTSKMYRSLPKTVRTLVRTPGALESKAQIKALGKQFGLTPKQIKSIITLVGARDAVDKTAKTQKGLRKLNTTSARPKVVPQGNEATDNKVNKNIRGFRKLNGQSAKPHVQPQGTEATDRKIANNRAGLRKLNTQSAKPHIEVQGADKAVGKIHGVSGALNGVPRNIPVSINIATYGAAAAIAAAHSAAVRARQAAGLATGGPVSGPGTGTSDSIPVNLSNGEFVINAAAAHRNRALLEAINGNSVPANRHYASGGSVRGPSVVERAPSGPLYLVLENGDTLTAHLTSVAQGVNGQAKRRGDMNARAGAGRRGA